MPIPGTMTVVFIILFILGVLICASFVGWAVTLSHWGYWLVGWISYAIGHLMGDAQA